jgi:hypothetical protein
MLLSERGDKLSNKGFPSLINLLEYEDKFIGVHNDKKIRIWDRDFENY